MLPAEDRTVTTSINESDQHIPLWLGITSVIRSLMFVCTCTWYSGRFVKQELWERWRAKQKLVSGSKHRGAFVGSRS